MAGPGDIRSWWNAQAQESDQLGPRGPIPAAVREAYMDAHPDDELPPPPPRSLNVVPLADEDPAPPPVSPERAPQHVRTPALAGLRSRRKPAAAGKGKAKPRDSKPRVPVDGIISSVWRGLAGMIDVPLPGTAMMMKFQAPVAGKLLEPVVKDTIADKILQPFARTTASGEALAVLLGPPALVTAIQLNPDLAPILAPALRELMLRMIKVGGPAMAESLKIEQEFEAEFGGTVDDLLAMMLGPIELEPDETPEQAQARIVRAAQEAVSSTADVA